MKFDKKRVEDSLERTSPRHRTAFAASCSERLLPSYRRFVLDARWGDPAPIERGLAFAWEFVRSGKASREEMQRLIEGIEVIQPDMDDFDSEFTSAAVDAAAAAMHAVECCVDGSVEHAGWAASAAHDTVHAFIEERDELDFNTDPAFWTKIDADPLMQRELATQDEQIALLESNATITDELIAHLHSTRGVLDGAE